MNNTGITNQKRHELKEISTTLREAKDKGEIKTINEGLLQIYSAQGHGVLKTYRQWEKEGKQVKKNEKALYLWSSKTEITINENGQEKTITFFPILAVFSENQVYTPSK